MTEPTAAGDRPERVVVSSETRIEAHRGPLPAPETFERYEMILPGTAERILAMAEEQSRHRQRLEQKVIDGDIAAQRLGVLIGGFVAVFLAAVAAIVAIWAHPAAGAFIGGLDVAGIVGAFVYGHRERRGESKAPRRD